MLEIKNVEISLKNSGRNVVENFSFSLLSGDKAVIIGEEGNGKSTLLKFIYSSTLVEDYCEFKGSVITKSKLAYLPQMMDEGFFESTLMDYFGDTQYYNHMNTLGRLGLSLDFILSEQKIGTLSGGEKVKVQLARLLMEEPDILLLDEPTNDLDIGTLKWLEGFIKKTKLPVLFISHDETLIEETANVILHMEQIIKKTKCRITVSRLSYREYLENRRMNFSHQDQVAGKQREEHQKQMDKWQKIYNSVDSAQGSISRQDPSGGRLLKKKMKTVLSMGKRFEREKEEFLDFSEEEEAILTKFSPEISVPRGKTVIDFNLSKLMIDDRQLSKNIKLFVSGNEHIGITGKNGAGKSTLLKIIWQELKGRADIIPTYMPQNYRERLNYEKTPTQYLADNYTKEDITRARTFMGSMKFTHEEMMSKIGNLSGGQRAKILFLEMVLKGSNVIVLDEPTRNFSPLSSPVVRAALSRFGGAIVSVSHDRKYLKEVCTKVFELTESGLQEMQLLNNK